MANTDEPRGIDNTRKRVWIETYGRPLGAVLYDFS